MKIFNYVILFIVFSISALQAQNKIKVTTDRFDYRPGESIKFSIEADHPENIISPRVYLWYGSTHKYVYLELNPKTKRFEGSIPVPSIINSDQFKFDIRYADNEDNQYVLKGNEHFPQPVFKDVIIDREPPKLNSISYTQNNSDELVITLDIEDNEALGDLMSAHIKQNGESLAIDTTTHCGKKKKSLCILKIKLPKGIKNSATLKVSIIDLAGNQVWLNSEYDFKFAIKETKGDSTPIQITNIQVVTCKKDEVTVNYNITGGSGVENSSGMIFSNSDQYSFTSATNVKDNYSLTVKMPELARSTNLRLIIFANGLNGTDAQYTIPKNLIDFSSIKTSKGKCKVQYIKIENPKKRFSTTQTDHPKPEATRSL